MFKVWNFNARGEIVIGDIEVRDWQHARQLAIDWNKEQDNDRMRVVMISNTCVMGFGTVTTVASI